MRGKAAGTLAILMALVLAGCTTATRQGPDGQSTTTQAPGYFHQSFQANGKTDTETFTFQNPTGSAHLTNGVQMSLGRLTVTLRDGSGDVIYQETSMGPSQGSQSGTRQGDPGTWTLELEWIVATGQGSITIVGG